VEGRSLIIRKAGKMEQKWLLNLEQNFSTPVAEYESLVKMAERVRSKIQQIHYIQRKGVYSVD
jgi:hypothetical protein